MNKEIEILSKTANGQWKLFKVGLSPANKTNSITLNHDPNDFGAYINGNFDHIKETNVPATNMHGFEPDDKMKSPESQVKIKSMMQDISAGKNMPPVLARQTNSGFQVLDGHHRFHAMKQSGVKNIPVKIVPNEHISEINKPKI